VGKALACVSGPLWALGPHGGSRFHHLNDLRKDSAADKLILGQYRTLGIRPGDALTDFDVADLIALAETS
jgi:hypothetical protein